MQQLIKQFSWVGLLVFGLQGAWAFSLGGPFDNNPNPITAAIVQGDAWQSPDIGYGLPADVNGPKNLGEEYRRNLPVMYYTCDANFWGFFGSNGVAAVDNAFAILNKVFTNNPTGMTNGLDGYSDSLSEFPLATRHLNYEAQALGLYDLKSYVLGTMVEQLGLANPIRYDWTLHDRTLIPNTSCPAGEEYLVVQRNFDSITKSFIQPEYSPYINDVLYTYSIVEFCTAPAPPQAVTIPASVDPTADLYSPVAAWGGGPTILPNLGYGIFYTGLTRDDVAGLRYLLASNNINFEGAPAGSVLQNQGSGGGANYGPPFLLYTSNYTSFAQAALTNGPVALAALFPGLLIASSSTQFVVVPVVTTVAYYTHTPGSDVGTSNLVVVSTTNYVPMANYTYTYANANLVITTNGYSTNTSAQLMTVSLGHAPGSDAGSPLVTNVSYTPVILNNGDYNTVWPSGDYYIDTNTCGPTVILSTLLTNVTATTNIIYAVSNSAASQSIVTYSTTHVFVAESPICATAVVGGVTNSPGLRRGIEKMQFVRADYDSLLSQTFKPITYTFSAVMITNSQAVNQTFTRVVTAPDILFSAADIAAGPNTPPQFNPVVGTVDRYVNFDQGNALPGLAGPGLIPPSTTIIFDKVGPVYFNYFSGLMDGSPYFNDSPVTDETAYYQFYFLWASFDGTTNDPVVYPDSESIQNMENQILIQLSITPANDVDYTVSPPELTYDPNMTFSARGGAFTPPFRWSATGLPAGLTLTTTNSVGMFSGPPTSGTYPNFILTMTDYNGRSVQWTFSITIP